MKKLELFALVLAIMLSCCACGSSSNETENVIEDAEQVDLVDDIEEDLDAQFDMAAYKESVVEYANLLMESSVHYRNIATYAVEYSCSNPNASVTTVYGAVCYNYAQDNGLTASEIIGMYSDVSSAYLELSMVNADDDELGEIQEVLDALESTYKNLYMIAGGMDEDGNRIMTDDADWSWDDYCASCISAYNNVDEALGLLVQYVDIYGDVSSTSITDASAISDNGEIEVSISIGADVSNISTGTVSFTLATNLPDDMVLFFTLSNDTTTMQSKAYVSNGTVTTAEFGSSDKKISGRYILEITSVVPSLQPDSVKKVIGTQGEFLTGSLVTQSSSGSNIVSVKYAFDF